MASSLAAIVAAARKRLWITNAYFAPRQRATDLLTSAARRGVDVRLLLPGRSDVPLVRHAGHGHYRAMLDGGVRIFEYQAEVLHAKTVVADEYVSAIGSSNLDFRSFHLNAECNVLILDEATAATFSRAFEEDMSKSVEIVPALWNRRTFRHRAGDAVARALGPFL
jgi:cardiolipin synthase